MRCDEIVFFSQKWSKIKTITTQNCKISTQNYNTKIAFSFCLPKLWKISKYCAHRIEPSSICAIEGSLPVEAGDKESIYLIDALGNRAARQPFICSATRNQWT
jgi:hypothetical protein